MSSQAAAAKGTGEQSDSAKPNIVYIIADDQGWGDAHCYNPTSPLATPGIDRIARQGMRFTDAHSASAVCTPTRYALLTGRYAWRTRLQRGWKYIHAKGTGGWSKGDDGKLTQLYNLDTDLAETTNQIDQSPERAEALRQRLMEVIANGRSTPGPKQANDVPVNP